MAKIIVLEISFDDGTELEEIGDAREAIAELLDLAGMTYIIEQRIEEITDEVNHGKETKGSE